MKNVDSKIQPEAAQVEGGGGGSKLMLECHLLKNKRKNQIKKFSRWLSGKESTCQCRRCGFDSWVGKIPWRRK